MFFQVDGTAGPSVSAMVAPRRPSGFGVPTVLVLRAWPRRWALVGLLALHAPVSELVQHFLLPNRSGDPWDAVADLGGVVLGVTLAVVGRRRRRW